MLDFGSDLSTVGAGVIREDRLEEDFSRKVLPLKNGGATEIAVGLVTADILRDLLEKQPEHFEVLLALARGQNQDLPVRSLAYLRRDEFLMKGAVIKPLYRDILLSSYQQTPDGPVIVNPFRLDDEADARAVQSVADSRGRPDRIKWLFDQIFGDDEPERGR